MNKLFFTCFFSLFTPISLLFGEIQLIDILWQPNFCTGDCQTSLLNRIKKIPGVETLSLTTSGGYQVAHVTTTKTLSFNYQTYDTVFRSIGVTIRYVKIKAKGKIKKEGKNYVLFSEESRTSFPLLGNPATSKNNFANPNSLYNRVISPDFLTSLDEAIKTGTAISIEGTLFEPERGPPLWLVIEKIDKPKAQTNK